MKDKIGVKSVRLTDAYGLKSKIGRFSGLDLNHLILGRFLMVDRDLYFSLTLEKLINNEYKI